MSKKKLSAAEKELRAIVPLRSNDSDPAVRKRFREIEKKGHEEFAKLVEKAREAERITPECLARIVY